MLQQINLYKEPPQKIIFFSFRHIVLLNLLFISILVGSTGFKLVNYNSGLSAFKKLEETQHKLNDSLVAAKNNVPNPNEVDSKLLTKNLAKLNAEKEYTAKIYNNLIELKAKKAMMLSQYLNAMTEPLTQDLWITKFAFKHNGNSIHFEGVTLSNSSVLAYLEDLGKNIVFTGKNFSNLQIFNDDSSNSIKFIVDS